MEGVMITDAKAMFNAFLNEPSGLGLEEKRSATEPPSLRDNTNKSGVRMRWAHSHAQAADGLTKGDRSGLCLLRNFLQRGGWKIIYDEDYMSARKRRLLGKDIHEAISSQGRTSVRKLTAKRREQQKSGENGLEAAHDDKRDEGDQQAGDPGSRASSDQ